MINTIRDDLRWRYATKQFDATKKVSEQDLQELLEALRLSASSFGLQPWKFIVVQNPALRKELQQHAWNQPQIVDASQLLVLCARTDIDETYVKKFVETLALHRKVSVDSLKSYQDMMLGFVAHKDRAALIEWAKLQVYIALGNLLAVCAHKRIDSCPMEGFDATAFDKILHLEKEHLTTTVLCAVGYRSANDAYALAAKVRFEMDELIINK